MLEHQQKYQAAIRAAREQGMGAFQTWFNREAAGTIPQILGRGFWDFSIHMLTPAVCACLHDPTNQVALEIGYGGGRLLHAACHYFKEVIGIDIHAEQAAVEQFLQQQGVQNVRLLTTGGDAIPLPAASIDFVYSFIVLQHLPTFEMFERYLQEVYRCLKPGGVAQLYFGKYTRLHPLYGVWHFRRGYRQVANRPANHITLVIRSSIVRARCRQLGFTILDSGSSYYRVPDGYPTKKGGQSYVTVKRDA